MNQCSLKRRKNDRQFLWEYMRRNRICKVENMLPLVDMSLANMMVFFGQLERAGYIVVRIPLEKKSKPKRFASREYVLKRNTGVLAPIYVLKQKRLYDRNVRELCMSDLKLPAIEISKEVSQVVPVTPLEYNKDRIRQIMRSEPEGISILALSERCGIVSAGAFAFALNSLKADGKARKIDKIGGVPIYKLEEVVNV